MEKQYVYLVSCKKCKETKMMVIWRKMYEYPNKKIIVLYECPNGHQHQKTYK